MKDRQSQILEYVIENRRVEVSEIAARFAVSQVTVRKDLDALSKSGLLKKEHGFAVSVSEDNMLSRMAYHNEAKRRIVRSAARLIKDGDLIMIESGSTCALLAEEVASSGKKITIITNSAFIAHRIRDYCNITVCLLGGLLQGESQVLVGPLTRAAALNFHVSRLFIGIDGYTRATGFTGVNLMRADVVSCLCKQSEEVVALTESSKFGRIGSVKLLPLDQVHKIYTEDSIPKEFQDHFSENGVGLVMVPSEAPHTDTRT